MLLSVWMVLGITLVNDYMTNDKNGKKLLFAPLTARFSDFVGPLVKCALMMSHHPLAA